MKYTSELPAPGPAGEKFRECAAWPCAPVILAPRSTHRRGQGLLTATSLAQSESSRPIREPISKQADEAYEDTWVVSHRHQFLCVVIHT